MHKDTAGGIGANAVKQTFDHEVRLLSLGWAKFIMGENAGQGPSLHITSSHKPNTV